MKTQATPSIKILPNSVVTTGDSYNNSGLEYRQMLLDDDETVLGIFGFDRTLFGKSKDKRWWMSLRRNRMNDVQAEVDGK